MTERHNDGPAGLSLDDAKRLRDSMRPGSPDFVPLPSPERLRRHADTMALLAMEKVLSSPKETTEEDTAVTDIPTRKPKGYHGRHERRRRSHKPGDEQAA